VALANVTFSIDRGEVVVIIGPNGAGKSTLMNILAGGIEPSSGSYRLFEGRQMKRFRDLQSLMGVCFQENVLVNLLTIREHFYLFGAFRNMKEWAIEEAMMNSAHILQLVEMIDNRAGDLSGGQKRKLCVSLSLLGNPPFVIMDEPTAGVDVQSRQLIWRTIAQLKYTTTIVTSHALEEAEAVSSRLFVVAGGRLPFAGTATELRKEFKCGYLLRIQGNVHNVFELARKYVPDAVIDTGRPDTIKMQVSKRVPGFLREFVARKNELGVDSYSFAVEQLEDMLLKLVESEEVQFQQKM
jgi:ABC-type multidrug transport system ATPase subunit